MYVGFTSTADTSALAVAHKQLPPLYFIMLAGCDGDRMKESGQPHHTGTCVIVEVHASLLGQQP